MAGSALTSADFADQGLALSSTSLGLGTLADARILLIDDSRFARKTINAILANHGFTNVKLAMDGDEGVRIAEEWQPELVITDLYMPVMTGFDVCRELRAKKLFRETPIVVQTSADTPSLRGDVFDAGATDLITKPINARELLSRIHVHLERLRLIESLKSYRRQMREELNSAKAMQMELLPAEQLIDDLEQLFPVRFAWHSQPCHGLAGDIWGADQLDENRVRVWSADFTGHGVRSALNTFRLNTFLRTSLKGELHGPSRWLAAVNEFLCDVLPIGQFATMLCCDIDFSKDMISIASAGAPEPVMEHDGRNTLVEIGGMPLGISDTATFEEVQLPFNPGCCLFAYSDALIETPTAEEPLYDTEGLLARLDELTKSPLEKRPNHLLSNLAEAAPSGLDDDLTLIFLQHNGGYTSRDAIASSREERLSCAEPKVPARSGGTLETIEAALANPVSSVSITIRTMQEAAVLAERLARQYPDPDTVATGIWELLANAIEHGNLGIKHSEKTDLILKNELNAEIERRLALPLFRDRCAQVEFRREPHQIVLTIQDEGEGFDFETYLEGKARLDAPNGRGIAIAQELCFDRLVYHGDGNWVEATLELPSEDGESEE